MLQLPVPRTEPPRGIALTLLPRRGEFQAACSEIGIEPITKPWDQRGDALSYVISKNLHRRHLNESQRAMVAPKIATMRQGGNGSKQHARANPP